jgi:hypothetical protein
MGRVMGKPHHDSHRVRRAQTPNPLPFVQGVALRRVPVNQCERNSTVGFSSSSSERRSRLGLSPRNAPRATLPPRGALPAERVPRGRMRGWSEACVRLHTIAGTTRRRDVVTEFVSAIRLVTLIAAWCLSLTLRRRMTAKACTGRATRARPNLAGRVPHMRASALCVGRHVSVYENGRTICERSR